MTADRRPAVAIESYRDDSLVQAVESGGGEVVSPEDADALVWTDPSDPRPLKALLDSSPARWIQLPFAGIESFVAAGVVDPDHTWTCAKGIYAHATAEHALALMLAASRHIHEHVRAGRWIARDGFGAPERRLKGARVLIVGAGALGRQLIAMLQPLGAESVAVNSSGRAVPGAAATAPVERLSSLLGDADFVVLAAASTPETRGMIGASELVAMAPGAWLVNVARGALVDTPALVEALESGSIGGPRSTSPIRSPCRTTTRCGALTTSSSRRTWATRGTWPCPSCGTSSAVTWRASRAATSSRAWSTRASATDRRPNSRFSFFRAEGVAERGRGSSVLLLRAHGVAERGYCPQTSSPSCAGWGTIAGTPARPRSPT